MTLDTRTPQEREYDRLALSTRPIGAPPDAPAPRLPSEEDVLGTIDGCPVHPVCSVDEDRHIYAVQMHWRGLRLESDGRGYIELPITGECGGDCTLEEWAQIKELARTDIVERLYSFAQSVVPASQSPDDDAPELPSAPVASLFDRQEIICDTIRDTFIMIDRRSGELVYQTKGDRSAILKPADTMALFQFFQRPTTQNVMLHVTYNYHMAHGSDDLKHVLAMVHDILGPMPELPAAGNARVQVERHVCDDEVDTKRFGKEIGTEFICEGVQMYFPDDLRYALLEPTNLHIDDRLDIGGFPLEHAEYFLSIFPKVVALLSDPRVKAMRARYEATKRAA